MSLPGGATAFQTGLPWEDFLVKGKMQAYRILGRAVKTRTPPGHPLCAEG